MLLSSITMRVVAINAVAKLKDAFFNLSAMISGRESTVPKTTMFISAGSRAGAANTIL